MTPRTALVTDSTSNLSTDLAAERHIYVVPLYVLWGQESLKDGVEISVEEFYSRLETAQELPKTSQASAQDFATIFETARAAEQADEVVCVVISSDLSGTYTSAIQAKDMVDFPVHVIDSRQVSWALGHAALAGATARDNGASPAEIVGAIRDAAARQCLLFTIESLEYLHRGGRIGNARRLLGSALNIKPVLQLRDGVVSSADNVRTRKRAAEHLLKVAETTADQRPIVRLAVIHGQAEDEARELLDKAVKKFHPLETRFSYLTPVLGVHTGPGALGIVVEWSA